MLYFTSPAPMEMDVIAMVHDEPDSIPIDGGTHDELITQLLERAQQEAESLESGASFRIELDPEEVPEGTYYMEIIGPVMVRAMDYGLLPGSCINWNFEFEKL